MLLRRPVLLGSLLFPLLFLLSTETLAVVCHADYQKHELAGRYQRDQEAREALSNQEPTERLIKQVFATDFDNRLWLSHVLEVCGWPAREAIGTKAARQAWIITLHGDNDPGFQRRAARRMKDAVRIGQADPFHYARLVDRQRRNTAEPQEYGTDYAIEGNTVRFRPVRAPGLLDARRTAIGLEPFYCFMHSGRRLEMAREWPEGVSTLPLPCAIETERRP